MGDDDQQADDDYLEQKFCKVYDKNDFFTSAVQLILAAFALFSLYIKRQQEYPRRTFRTWSLDVGKQALGACYAHVLNMIVAAVISHNIRGESVLEDQCAWYGLSYLIDCTLGLFLAVIFVKLLDQVANDCNWTHLKNSGVYSGPNGIYHWMSQVTAWFVILTITKIIIYFFMWAFSEPLAWLGTLLFEPFNNIRFELVFVMILFPGVLNVVYFWIADSFLKAKKGQEGAHEEEEQAPKEFQLMEDNKEQEQPAKEYQPAPWSTVPNRNNDASAALV